MPNMGLASLTGQCSMRHRGCSQRVSGDEPETSHLAAMNDSAARDGRCTQQSLKQRDEQRDPDSPGRAGFQPSPRGTLTQKPGVAQQALS